ncbi:hypothetical protein LJK88_14995 [Paenibacillus sp. P26]|nr:hypothetical protein LJK88_14995 [Paenibacillus sp. P26]
MNEQTHTIRNSDEKLFDAVVNLLAALILLAVLYPRCLSSAPPSATLPWY